MDEMPHSGMTYQELSACGGGLYALFLPMVQGSQPRLVPCDFADEYLALVTLSGRHEASTCQL
jgi:hypothetical protein